MLDLSYSPQNLETIFEIESRKGDMKPYMPPEYSKVMEKISLHVKQVTDLRKKRYKFLSTIEKNEIDAIESQIKEFQKKKDRIIQETLIKYAQKINKTTRITLKEINRTEGIYALDLTFKELFFLSKKIQYNLRKTFDVKQSNRYLLLSQLKLLLNEDTPRYVIKTDITKFYESIPQDKLIDIILKKRDLDTKTKSFIKNVIEQYENMKDPSIFDAKKGIPRGVGFSAYLSEIYMQELDNYIKTLTGVVYYARYVDDIIIIMQKDISVLTINEEYRKIQDEFLRYDLALKNEGETDSEGRLKCQLIDLTQGNRNIELQFLGYLIKISREDIKKKTESKFHISHNKNERIKERISKSIEHFNQESKFNLEEAKMLLFDSLKILSGNTKLSGHKSRVKTGIYYSNNLIDNTSEINNFNVMLNNELSKINPYEKLFNSPAEKLKYINKLKRQILSAINFELGFKNKRTYNINSQQRKKILKVWR